MGVMKHRFNTVVELKIVYKYGVLIALNSLYHLLKTVWPWAVTTPENLFQVHVTCCYCDIVFLLLIATFLAHKVILLTSVTYNQMRAGFNAYKF